jgi:hypothetical protein
MPIEGEDAVVQSVVAWHDDRMNADIQSFLRINDLSKDHTGRAGTL